MLLRIFQVGLVAGSMLVAGYASAQVIDSTTVPSASSSYSSPGTIRQEEADQEALARQMDEFHNRLKALEEGNVDSSIVDRVDELESGLESTVEDVGNIGGKFKDYLRAGHGESNIRWFGRLHVDMWAFPDADADVAILEGGDPQNRLLIRRARLGAGGDINTNMFFKLEAEFAGGIRASFRDAYLGF
ncbi:MAG: hypothetical protein ACR2NP_21845, partial [Pirellulaceae bacterium]